MILSIPCEKYTHHLSGSYEAQPITASDQSAISSHLDHVQVWQSLLECNSLSTAPRVQHFDSCGLEKPER